MALEGTGNRPNPPPWETLGRGTAAGRALFALYNGDLAGRAAGNAFSAANRAAFSRRQSHSEESTRTPAEVTDSKKGRSQRPTVRVPHFRKKSTANESDWEGHPGEIRGKRPAADILKEMKENKATGETPPPPKGPLLDDREKERLARIFEWNGKPPQEVKVKKAEPKPEPGSTADVDLIFQSIVKEIEERERFLADMRGLGCAQKYEAQMRAEIMERVMQLRKLDADLSATIGT